MKVKTLFFALWTLFLFVVQNVHAQPGKCKDPKNLSTAIISTTDVTFSVKAENDAEKYLFRYRKQGVTPWQSEESSAATVEITGLEAGATYEWEAQKVCSEDPLSVSGFKSGKSFTMPECPMVTGLQSGPDLSTDEATFSWSANQEAKTYKLSYRQAGGSRTTIDNIKSATYTIDIFTFEGDVTYEWQVSAYCQAPGGVKIYSEPSALQNFTVPAQYTCDAPTQLNNNLNIDNKTLDLSWSGPQRAEEYYLEYRQTGQNWQTIRNVNTSSYAFPLIDLAGDVTYEWRVGAYCRDVDGKQVDAGWSAVNTFSVSSQYTCSTPQGLEPLVSVRDNELQLRWQGTILAESYRVDYQVSGGDWVKNTNLAHPCLRVSLDELDHAAGYEWRVRTNCDDGNGNTAHSGWSATATFNINDLNPTLPEPTDWVAYSTSESAVKMVWQDPSNGQYDFEIRRVDQDNCADEKVMTIPAGVTVAMDEGLDNNVTYYYKIRSISGGEVSEFTPLQSAYTYAQGELPDYEEYLELTAIYEALDGDGWTDNTQWLSGQTYHDFQNWYGVAVKDGDVSGIELPDNNLTGQIPDAFSELTGLENITLSGAGINGKLPASLSTLPNLKTLKIYATQIDGTIPGAYNNMTPLQTLHLNDNNLSDPIPALNNLKDLKSLHLTGNQFTGWPPDLEALTSMADFHYADYNLGGGIPEAIWSWTDLERLDISGNDLEGNISEAIGNLTQLKTFMAGDNQLTGTIPPAIGNCSNLTRLDLSENELKGELPLELARILSLEEIYVNDNHFSGLMDLEFSVMPNIKIMHLHNNALRSIPDFSFGKEQVSLDPATVALKAENNKLEWLYVENNLKADGSDLLKTFT